MSKLPMAPVAHGSTNASTVLQRLEDLRGGHEETLERERRAHRDRTAEGEGRIARLEHDIKKTYEDQEK